MLTPRRSADELPPNPCVEWLFKSPEVSNEECQEQGGIWNLSFGGNSTVTFSQETPIPCENVSSVSSSVASSSRESSCVFTHEFSQQSHQDEHQDVTSEERRLKTSTEVARLALLENMVAISFPQLKATINKSSCGTGILNITHSQMHYHPPAGYIYRVRLLVTCKSDGFNYDNQVFFNTICKGNLNSNEDFILLCGSLLRSNGYVFCPGIDYIEYMQTYYSVIRFHSKQVSIMEAPFQRVNAKGCLWWFKLPKNATTEEKRADEVCCSRCKRLRSDLEYQKRRSLLVSPAKRVRRQAASSNYPAKFLSPASTVKRKTNAHKQTFKLNVAIAKHSNMDVTLDDAQHDEMCKISEEIEKDSSHINEIFKEAASYGLEDSLREVWLMDKQRREFMKDQIKNGNN